MPRVPAGQAVFRLWIAGYAEWRPRCWTDQPPEAVALEPVDDAVYTAAEAAMFVRGFNGSMLAAGREVWAVAVPVVIRYEGDAVAGQRVQGFAFAEQAAPSC